ncbi:hypothetical protein B0H15DRAFT_799333 [Mycena belliarum]|uniref:F-box domain-containing protein n=1 Tax=Mycena belliarum TaxID=1033014 RepID=A0AAD6U7F3_9AGAR|nr:hypothetical protein B0H15DRAFT_799333 [Mycena belliae]
MSQYWAILNIDKRRKLSLSNLGRALFYGLDKFSIKLCHPPNKVVFLSTSSLKKAGAVRRSTACHLLQLPNELLHAIFELLDDLEDAMLLGLTCQTLWDIGRMRMEKEVQKIATGRSWAGDRIICIGHFPKDGDTVPMMPPGLLTADEEAEFLDPLPDTFSPRDEEGAVASTEIPSLYRLKCKVNSNRQQHLLLSDFFAGTIGHMMWSPDGSRCIKRGDFEVARQLFDQYAWSIEHLARTKKWCVLRNLSRHQVVFEADFREFNKKPNMAKFWFGNLVLMHICWSSNPAANRRGDGKIYRGDWAGDRFDIVTEDDFKRECAGSEEEWTDVGDELLQEAEELWAFQEW